MVVWELSKPLSASKHNYKYRLYFGRAGQCLVRYDNEQGKGDHVHYPECEIPYQFISLAKLVADFEGDIQNVLRGVQ